MIDTDFGTGVTHVEHEEIATSEDLVQADVIPSNDVPIVEETFVQDLVDDMSMEDMADTYGSYDAVLAETEDHVAGVQAADVEVTTPITAHTSPTETGIWPFINILSLLLLDSRDFLKCTGQS